LVDPPAFPGEDPVVPSDRESGAGSRLPQTRSEAGFTLIEVLVSALLVVLIASAGAAALISGAHFSADQRWRSEANALAAQDQERLRGLSDEQLAGLNQSRTVTLPTGGSFKVSSTASFLDATGGSSCTSSATAYYRTVSTVTWTESTGAPPVPVTVTSVLARPVSGDLLTQVTDDALAPLAGATVTATGPSRQSATTDANGCVVFAGLTPGSYAVALAAQNPAGQSYVDANGKTSINTSATVTSGTTAVSPAGAPFHLGLAGSVTGGTLTTQTAGVAGEADTISWIGNGAVLGMSAYKSTTPSSAPANAIAQISPLFPFDTSSTLPAAYTNNYSIWAGRCLQNQPPAGYDQFSVTPGSAQTVSVLEPVLAVATVNYTSGTSTTAVKPNHVKLTFTSTAGAACPTYSWYPTLSSAASPATEPATGWLAYPGQPFATAATTGATASGATQPGSPQTGAVTVCADYSGYKAQATVENDNFTTPTVVPALSITQGANPGTC
jgi:Tfp pilus assembly protein PilV